MDQQIRYVRVCVSVILGQQEGPDFPPPLLSLRERLKLWWSVFAERNEQNHKNNQRMCNQTEKIA